MKYSKISFLRHAPELDLEFLISQEIEVTVFKVDKFALVVYRNENKKLWTEHIYEPYEMLTQVSTSKVLNSLQPKERREFIENWSTKG